MGNQRNPSIELLRLVLMFMVTIQHWIFHGLGLVGLTNESIEIKVPSNQMFIMLSVSSFCACAVNCFIIISGYFSINTSWRKLYNLAFMVLFYTILFCSIPLFYRGDIKEAFYSFLFISHSEYWFIKCYILLMFFAPMINIAFKYLTRQQMSLTLGGLIFIAVYIGFIWRREPNPNGYTLLQFIMLYSVGRFIHMYEFDVSLKKALLGYVLSSMILALSAYVIFHNSGNSNTWSMFRYNNPLLILSALFLFYIFIKITPPYGNVINKLSISALAIYLIQDSRFGYIVLYPWVGDACVNCNALMTLGLFAVLSLFLFVVSYMIDRIRIYFSDLIYHSINGLISKRI